MKVIKVNHFVFKGSSSSDIVYFVEGIEDFMILTYNNKYESFMFAPIKYTGNKKNLKDIIKEFDGNISLLSRFRIKLASASNILDVNLGKASFHLTHYFKNEAERDLYLKELKNAKLIPHERYPDEINHILSGYVEYEDDLETFIENLKKINTKPLSKPNQLEIPKECYTEL